ncbi:MAG: sensor histidine kinase [Burkholderiales bacterium]|nr:MAG: sensor histidine kinase [Burkholderiales bacterium]
MTRRILLILLATIALNAAIGMLLVVNGPDHHAFWSTHVQSQVIGLSIAAMCWAVVPRVERSEGDPKVAVPLFGAAIVGGALGGIQLAELATRALFDEPTQVAAGHGVMSLRTVLLSLTVGAIGTVVFYSRERLRHARTRAESEGWRAIAAERTAAQAQLQALRAQVEPHFLFNTLANVSALIDRDPAAARGLIDDLARHLRATLSHARAESTSLGEELDVTASLLGIMKRRLGERLQWRFDVPEALRAVSVAPMLVQPLVENAVKHGIEPLSAGGTIEVRARREPDGTLVVEVADTGRGLPGTGDPASAPDPTPQDGSGTGLVNLAARLRAIYGPAARLALRENAPRGTVARLTLPPRPAGAA